MPARLAVNLGEGERLILAAAFAQHQQTDVTRYVRVSGVARLRAAASAFDSGYGCALADVGNDLARSDFTSFSLT